MKTGFLWSIILTSLVLSESSCKKNDSDLSPVPPEVEVRVPLTFNESSVKQMTIRQNSDESYSFSTTGGDPQISTIPMTSDCDPAAVVLSFDYQAPAAISNVQVFLGPPITGDRSVVIDDVPQSSSWRSYSYNLAHSIQQFEWGAAGSLMRIDFGTVAGKNIRIRNLCLRSRTQAELDKEEEERKWEESQKMLDESLNIYLSHTYPDQVTSVELNLLTNSVSIDGTVTGSGEYWLAEVTPYQDVTLESAFQYLTPVIVRNGTFHLEMPRYEDRPQGRFDRLLSKWVLVRKNGSNYELASHARHLDRVTPLPISGADVVTPVSKKGLGGVTLDYMNLFPSDLDELGIKSVTYNLVLPNLCYVSPLQNTLPYDYCGKRYYINKTQVDKMDRQLRLLKNKGIVVAAILLITPNSADKAAIPLYRHPAYLSKGTYSMPNMTTFESVHCYAAALSFLAERYSGADNSNGRIQHWIMHNEVDQGHVWTNMGDPDNTPVLSYMDAYVKSLRMASAILRQYSPDSEVFASFTHYWTDNLNTTNPSYTPKNMLSILNKYSLVEGDFKWALAYHSYPQNLRDPRTWLDAKATFSMQTPIISFKNLEVLDKWIKQPENMYMGRERRRIWLSENGTSSPSYSDEDLKNQAAGFAYAWKKIKVLDGIEAVQWHRWVDHVNEGGLLFGLRKLEDDPTDPAGKKEVFKVFSAAGTALENSMFSPYLSVIGIPNWNIIESVE